MVDTVDQAALWQRQQQDSLEKIQLDYNFSKLLDRAAARLLHCYRSVVLMCARPRVTAYACIFILPCSAASTKTASQRRRDAELFRQERKLRQLDPGGGVDGRVLESQQQDYGRDWMFSG